MYSNAAGLAVLALSMTACFDWPAAGGPTGTGREGESCRCDRRTGGWFGTCASTLYCDPGFVCNFTSDTAGTCFKARSVREGGSCNAWEQKRKPEERLCSEGMSCVFVGEPGTVFGAGSAPCVQTWCCEPPSTVCGRHETLPPCPGVDSGVYDASAIDAPAHDLRMADTRATDAPAIDSTTTDSSGPEHAKTDASVGN
jgi:hypothetical protein